MGLKYAGFLVTSCPLKKDSKARVMKSRNHRENLLTACYVSKELKFTKEGKEIMILQNKTDEWY
uniref:SH3 domain-containing protein n=1 Tax=Strongyloides venezuelensis TaxID=75913 RepID=A0A0K0FLT6_STRVS